MIKNVFVDAELSACVLVTDMGVMEVFSISSNCYASVTLQAVSASLIGGLSNFSFLHVLPHTEAFLPFRGCTHVSFKPFEVSV